MFSFAMLVFATLCTVIMLVALIKGKQFEPLVENLDSSDYFLKNFYTIGFYLNSLKLFKLRGTLLKSLMDKTKLIYDDNYNEYYANLCWAQFLSLSFMTLSVGTALISLINSNSAIIIAIILIFIILVIWNMSIAKVDNLIKQRRSECEYEFSNMVAKLSLLINSGMILREAWQLIAYGKSGALYDLMKKSCEDMDNGDSDQQAIRKFGVLSDSPEIKKFTGLLIQGLEKGNAELSDFLLKQTSELWAHKRQLALQKGEIAAGKLVIPLGLMFGGVIMIVISAAMQSMAL